MVENVAVYWDFENIHASVCTKQFGQMWYRENRTAKQPPLVDITSIMEFINGCGSVNINKAYGNWSFFHNYSYDLHEHSVDLIQLFPRGRHGKNGADIRMAIDVIEDLSLNPHLTLIIIIGGDSDYVAIAQKVKQKGKTIIGIGVKETTNQFWIKSCNEFKFYSSLLLKSASIESIENEGYEEEDINEAKELLRKAVSRLISKADSDYALKAAVKPMMMRLDPSFDESNYNYASFTDFLEDCLDAINIVKGKKDHLISLKKNVAKPNAGGGMGSERLHPYDNILKQQNLRLPKIETLMLGINETCNIFQEEGTLSSYAEYRDKLLRRLKTSKADSTESDAAKIKDILFKVFPFYLDKRAQRISLCSDITSPEILFEKVAKMLVKRILDGSADEPDLPKLSRLIYGDENRQDQVDALVQEYYDIHRIVSR